MPGIGIKGSNFPCGGNGLNVRLKTRACVTKYGDSQTAKIIKPHIIIPNCTDPGIQSRGGGGANMPGGRKPGGNATRLRARTTTSHCVVVGEMADRGPLAVLHVKENQPRLESVKIFGWGGCNTYVGPWA